MLRQLLDDSQVLNWVVAHFEDLRTQDQITHPLSELLRTQILLLAQGWTHADDADALREDPILRLAVSDRKGQAPLRTPDGNRPQGLASQPTLSRLLEQASTAYNREVLEEAVLRSARSRCQLLERRTRYEELAVDLDALPMPVHGHQAGVAYNGYFHASGYHPLLLGSAQTGDFFGAVLRPGNVHAHEGASQAVGQRLDWIQSHLARRLILRFDAASVSGSFLSELEERTDTSYVARIKKNARLEERARAWVEGYQQELARHPEELREEGFRCRELVYQARSWQRPRRVVLVLVPCETEELPIARHFFLITDLSPKRMSGRDVVAFYRQRGPLRAHAGRVELHPHAAALLDHPPQATLPGSRAAAAHPVPGRLRRQPGDPDLESAGLQPASPRPPGRRARSSPARPAAQIRTLDDGSEPGSLSPPGLPAPAVPRHLARAQGRGHPDPRDGGRLGSAVEIPGHAQTG